MLGFLCCVLGACAQTGDIESVSAEEFESVISRGGVTLVDVRRDDEFRAGHIPGSVNVDVSRDGFAARVDSISGAVKTVAVYCRSGKRSMKAAHMLAKRGYRVVNLRGGWLEWAAEGKPRER